MLLKPGRRNIWTVFGFITAITVAYSVVYPFMNSWINKHAGTLDNDIVETRSVQKVAPLILDGKVKEIRYSRKPTQYSVVQMVLQDGSVFWAGPETSVLNVVKTCGQPCAAIELIQR